MTAASPTHLAARVEAERTTNRPWPTWRWKRSASFAASRFSPAGPCADAWIFIVTTLVRSNSAREIFRHSAGVHSPAMQNMFAIFE